MWVIFASYVLPRPTLVRRRHTESRYICLCCLCYKTRQRRLSSRVSRFMSSWPSSQNPPLPQLCMICVVTDKLVLVLYAAATARSLCLSAPQKRVAYSYCVKWHRIRLLVHRPLARHSNRKTYTLYNTYSEIVVFTRLNPVAQTRILHSNGQAQDIPKHIIIIYQLSRYIKSFICTPQLLGEDHSLHGVMIVHMIPFLVVIFHAHPPSPPPSPASLSSTDFEVISTAPLNRYICGSTYLRANAKHIYSYVYVIPCKLCKPFTLWLERCELSESGVRNGKEIIVCLGEHIW